MNKELQDLAWSVLPKEFKEEVKKIYNADDPLVSPEENELFDYIFGEHNLISDTEPDENKNLSNPTPLTDKKVEPEGSDSQFDTILKDGFRNERRLNIATQILSGIVASSKPCKHPVKRAVELADALIAECEKGGKS